jgi:phage tail-like protein
MKDPTGSFRFWVEIDGLLVAGFTEVSGLQSEVEVEEYREGGVNDYIHVLPRIVKYTSIILRRGVTNSDNLWSWYEKVTEGTIQRKNGSIILLEQNGVELWRWNFYNAYPVKWVGPELNSVSSEIAVETLEITHQGLKGIASS